MIYDIKLLKLNYIVFFYLNRKYFLNINFLKAFLFESSSVMKKKTNYYNVLKITIFDTKCVILELYESICTLAK